MRMIHIILIQGIREFSNKLAIGKPVIPQEGKLCRPRDMQTTITENAAAIIGVNMNTRMLAMQFFKGSDGAFKEYRVP